MRSGTPGADNVSATLGSSATEMDARTGQFRMLSDCRAGNRAPVRSTMAHSRSCCRKPCLVMMASWTLIPWQALTGWMKISCTTAVAMVDI